MCPCSSLRTSLGSTDQPRVCFPTSYFPQMSPLPELPVCPLMPADDMGNAKGSDQGVVTRSSEKLLRWGLLVALKGRDGLPFLCLIKPNLGISLLMKWWGNQSPGLQREMLPACLAVLPHRTKPTQGSLGRRAGQYSQDPRWLVQASLLCDLDPVDSPL